MTKKKIFLFVLYVLVFFGTWNLIEFLFSTFITRNGFSFALFGNAIIPTVVALVTGYLILFARKPKE